MTGYATAGTMTTVQQSTDPAAKPTSRKRFLTVAALALMLVPLLAGASACRCRWECPRTIV